MNFLMFHFQMSVLQIHEVPRNGDEERGRSGGNVIKLFFFITGNWDKKHFSHSLMFDYNMSRLKVLSCDERSRSLWQSINDK
jgi:hypothetical protein